MDHPAQNADLEEVRRYGRSVPESFAGALYCERERRIQAYFVGGLAEHERRLVERLGEPSNVSLLPARFSVAELQRISDVVAQRAAELDGCALSFSRIDIASNTVRAHAFTHDAARVQQMFDREFGGAVVLEVEGVEPYEQEPNAWQCYEVLEPSRLQVRFSVRPGDRVSAVDVQEDRRRVVIRVVVDRWQGVAYAVADRQTAEARLSGPLGRRKVIDGTSGRRGRRCSSQWRIVGRRGRRRGV